MDSWYVLPNIYTCTIKDADIITERSEQTITQVDGTHTGRRNNNDLKGFYIIDSVVHYFPLEIPKIFKNLEAFGIYQSGLKEIRKSYLQEFPEVKNFNFAFNEIEVLEPNLFLYNNNLKVVSLYGNKISHIDSNVFQYFMNQLSHLCLTENVCRLKCAIDNRIASNSIMSLISTGNCKDEEKLRKFQSKDE